MYTMSNHCNHSDFVLYLESLEDGPKEVGGVEGRKRDQEEVEGVLHLLAGDDEAGHNVSQDAQGGAGGEQDPLHPKLDPGQVWSLSSLK